MSISDRIFRPFETLIRPLEIPYRPLPASGPFALLWHFVAMFAPILFAVALLSMMVEAINLFLIWSLSDIIDGVTAKGAVLFLSEDWPLLALMAVLLFPISPLLSFLSNALFSQTAAISLPAAIQWQGHKAVERQDIAFFHDLFAGQVASRLAQVAGAVQQQIAVAFYSIPNFAMHFLGSVFLLGTVGLPFAIAALVWMAAAIGIAVLAVPHFSERAKRSARQKSLVVGAMTDVYSNIQMVK